MISPEVPLPRSSPSPGASAHPVASVSGPGTPWDIRGKVDCELSLWLGGGVVKGKGREQEWGSLNPGSLFLIL